MSESGGDFILGAEARSVPEHASGRPQPGRAGRLLSGWSANLLQMLLGVTQQVALIPIFLHFWNGETLSAWLSIYAVGNLMLVADCGLQVRSINEFLGLKAGADGDERSARFFASMAYLYVVFLASLAAMLLLAILLFPPSIQLGFAAIPHFDLALSAMMLGVLLTLLGNPATALYRSRGYYGRAVMLQCVAMLVAQLGQFEAVATTGSLIAVTLVFVLPQATVGIYFTAIDAPRLFPFLRHARGSVSPVWMAGQLRTAFPFAIAGAAELAVTNVPVLLISAFVSDRLAVAQWALTRVFAGLVRSLCQQTTLPLAAELGHDFAIGEMQKLRRLYARGSVLVSLIAAGVVSALLAFSQDFFAIWTHGAIPYDPALMLTLLIGTVATSPSILAAGFANYSGRGKLLASAKVLQLALFAAAAACLLPWLGVLGIAFAIVASDVVAQLGWLTIDVLRRTLLRPAAHMAFLMVMVAAVVLGGWWLGVGVGAFLLGAGLPHFLAECAVWLLGVALLASPLWNGAFRDRLAAVIPL